MDQSTGRGTGLGTGRNALVAGVAIATLALLGVAGHAAASPQAALSAGREATEAIVRRHPTSEPLIFEVDVETLAATDTESMLHAIADRRRAGGLTIAVVGTAADGAAIVALACDALVTLPSARIRGATSDWCTSPSRRDDLVATGARLGRIPELLVARLLEPAGALSWDRNSGFLPSGDGAVLLASDGTVLECSAIQLEQTGLASRGFKTADAAMTAVRGGLIKERPVAAGMAVASEIPRAPAQSGAGSRSPTSPGQPPAKEVSTEPAAPLVDMKKLSPKLADYQEALTEFKAKLKAFDRYYQGIDGVWTSQHRSLRAVWQSKTEMTRDKDTKVRCSRLQQDIRELITKIESIARSIEKICDDKEHPEVVRTSSGLETLRELREAIQRNEVDDYDKYKPLAERLR